MKQLEIIINYNYSISNICFMLFSALVTKCIAYNTPSEASSQNGLSMVLWIIGCGAEQSPRKMTPPFVIY